MCDLIFKVSMYKMLPLRTFSRLWGYVMNDVPLPVFIRSPILRAYSRSFGCNVEEALVDDLKQYKNLGEFFKRELKPGVRPISSTNGIVSPADGTIVHFGKASEGKLEQVKGITYPIENFLGPPTWKNANNNESNLSESYQKRLLKNPENELYHCVVYLAPGDYHRFHSPASWKVKFRRHFPGALLSVKPTFVSWLPGLFHINERVVYYGDWKHGFFSMAAVGATNVGSVKVYFDKVSATQNKYFCGDN